ncbi:hypothetical protein [Lysinibacillus pakistanensis]|uniref:hypothetical protein n=1 Tax=Lysinibacillus pakistanensis TaxID=759811 RepID=UPI003D2A62FE
MAEQFFHLKNRLRTNNLEIIMDAKNKSEIAKAKLGNPDINSIDNLRELIFGGDNKIAPILNSNLANQNLCSIESSILRGAQSIKARNIMTDNVNLKRNFYFDLTQNIVDAFSNKKQSSQSAMFKTIEATKEFAYAYNEHVKTSSSFSAVQRSIDYLKENKEGIVSFDLETFSGRNQNGKQMLDKITEFSFLTYDNINAKNASKTVTGYVGITSQKEEMKYQSILDKFKANPMNLTSLEEIILKYFAKLGCNGVDIVEDANVAGRFVVLGGMNEKDIKMTVPNIKEGIKKARDIGERQRQTILANGLMQWEQDLSDAILEIQTTKKSILGHNIINVAIPWLNQHFSSARKEVKDYIRIQGGSTNITIGRHRIADILPLMQHAMENRVFREDYLSQDTRAMLAKYGLSPYTQKALSNLGFSSGELEKRMASSEMHTSTFNAKETFNVLRKSIQGKNIIDYALNAGKEINHKNIFGKIKGNGSQLFYGSRTINGNQDGIMGFRVDPLDGQFYTMDGYIVHPKRLGENTPTSNNVIFNRGVNEYFIKKGRTYTVEGIVCLEAIEKHGSEGNEHLGRYIEVMRETHPALAVNEIIAVKMRAVFEYNGKNVPRATTTTLKNEEVSYVVAPMKVMQSFFNNNMVMFAEKDKTGQFQLKKGVQRLLKSYSLTEGNEKLVISKEKTGNLIKDVIESGAQVNVVDNVNRMIQDMDFDKFKSFSGFVDFINKEVEAISSSAPIQEKRRAVIYQAIENGRSIAEKIAKNIPLSQIEQEKNIGLLHEILNLKDYEESQIFYSERVNKAISLIDYFTGIKPIVGSIFNKVNMLGANDTEKNYLFKLAMDIAVSKIKEFNNKQADVKNVLRQINADYFEISMKDKGKQGIPLSQMAIHSLHESVLLVNLTNGESNLLRKIVDDKYIGDSIELKKRLVMLMDRTAIKNKVIGHQSVREYMYNNTPYIIARDFIEQLKELRKEDPSVGYILPLTAPTNIGIPDIYNAMESGLDYKNLVKQCVDTIKKHKPGTIIDIKGISKPGNENQLNTVALDIVTNILMDKFNRDEFKKYGYTDQQINWISKTREIRERDYMLLIKEIIKGVSVTDMFLHFDRGNRLFAIQDGNRQIDLSDVPRERIMDGVIYTQVGSNCINLMTHLDVDMTRNGSQITSSQINLKSDVGMALKNVWPLEFSIVAQQKRGIDPIIVIQSYISRIAAELNEGSSGQHLNEHGSNAICNLAEKEFVNSLVHIPGIDNVIFGIVENETSRTEKNYFLEQIKKKGFDYDKMNDFAKGIYFKYRKDIMEHVFNQVGVSVEVQNVLDVLSNRTKSELTVDGTVQNNQHSMEAFKTPSYLLEISTHNYSLRQEENLNIIDKISTESSALNGKEYLELNVRTSVGLTYLNRQINSFDITVQMEKIVNRAYVGSEGFKQRVYNAATFADEQASERLHHTRNIYEGGAVASSRLAEAIFQTYEYQRVYNLRKLFDDHGIALENIKKIQKFPEIVPVIRVKENGEIEFKYRQGKCYKQDSDSITEMTDRFNNITTKSDGFLRLGFSKLSDISASEDEVKKTILQYTKDKSFKMAGEDAFMKIAGDEFYSMKFHVASIKEVTNILENRVEKGITDLSYTVLSEFTTIKNGAEISALFKIHNELVDVVLSELKENGLKRALFDTVNIEGKIIPTLDNLNTEKILGIIKKLNDKNFETYSETNVISEQFNGALYLNDKEIKKITASELEPSQIIIRAYDEEQAAKNGKYSLKDVFVGKGLETIYRGLTMPQMGSLDERQISNQFVVVASRNQKGIDNSANSLVDDYTSFTRAVKIDFTKKEDVFGKGLREFKYSHVKSHPKIYDDFIEISPNQFDERLKKVYEIINSSNDQEKAVLKDEFHSKAFLEPIVQTVQKDMFAQNVDQLFINYGNTVQMKDSGLKSGEIIEYKNVSMDLLSEESRRLVQVAHVTAQAFGGNVSVLDAQLLYSSAVNRVAADCTTGRINEDKLRPYQNLNFKDIDLMGIDFTLGDDVLSFKDGIFSSLYNQNASIDLSSVDEDILKDAGISGNKLAIGVVPSRKSKNTNTQDDIYTRLKDIQYSTGYISGSRDQSVNFEVQDYKRHRHTIKTNLQKIDTLVYNYATFKDGARQVSEIQLENPTIRKAALLNFEDLINSPPYQLEILKNHKVDGKSILEHQKADIILDFDIIPNDLTKNRELFNEDYMKSIGIKDKHEMNALLRSAVQVMTHHNSTNHESSIKTGTMLMSDNSYRNEVISYFDDAISANIGAYDAKSNQFISPKLQVLSLNELNAQHNFDQYKDSNYELATSNNPYFANEIKKDIRSIAKANVDTVKMNIAERALTSENNHSGFNQELQEQYNEDFRAAEMNAINNYAKQENMALDMAEGTLHDNRQNKAYLQQTVQEIEGNVLRYNGGEVNESLGELNLPVRMMDNLVSGLLKNQLNERQDDLIFENILTHTEKEFQASKHNKTTIFDNSMDMRDSNSTFRKVVEFTRYGENDLVDGFEKSYNSGQAYNSIRLEDQGEYFNRGVVPNQDTFNHLDLIDQTKNGASVDMIKGPNILTEGSNKFLDVPMNPVYIVQGDEGIMEGDKLLSYDDSLPSSKDHINWISPTSSGLDETTVYHLESGKNAIPQSGINGKDLAFGALGMAGSTMTYHSQSSETAAAVKNDGSLYDVPIMTDNATAMLQTKPNQGYVININASTPRGQKHAEEAIRQAMVTSYNSTNVNVSMNINNSGGNITDSTIERLIQGMLA